MPGGSRKSKRRRAGQLLLHSPFHPLYLRTFGRHRARAIEIEYAQWVSGEEVAGGRRGKLIRRSRRAWHFQPTVSILIPTYQPRKEWLDQAITSVKAQSYEKWQLCICDDASSESWVREYLRTEAAADSRIRVSFRESNGGISAALNGAGELAAGEYVTFLDHDDMLHPFALHYVVEACQEDSVDVLYSDEDYLNPSGERCGPTFKPDWSPELLTSCMYFGHLLVARRGLVEEAGWFRSAYDGAQDYDLALRLVERARKIRHIRRDFVSLETASAVDVDESQGKAVCPRRWIPGGLRYHCPAGNPGRRRKWPDTLHLLHSPSFYPKTRELGGVFARPRSGCLLSLRDRNVLFIPTWN